MQTSIVFVSLAVSYFVFPHPITKVLSILFMAYSVYIFKGKKSSADYGSNIFFGLLLSSVGDIALEICDENVQLFLTGIVFFLLAHLLYIRSFTLGVIPTISFTDILVLLYFIGIMWHLLPSVDTDLVVPVAVYGVVISVMGRASIIRFKCNTTKINLTSKYLSLAGAISFILSDTVLAIDKFKVKLPHGKTVVMLTYYVGQALIGASSITMVNEEKVQD